mgnify:CR=1 FL=1
MEFLRRCWAEINFENIKYNLEQYKKCLKGKTELMCVVKASCYGHSDELTAPFLQNQLGVKWFAVSNLNEAVRLRKIGITGQILILGYTPPVMGDQLIKYDIIQACTEYDFAVRLSKSATAGNVRIHAAIDTGMARIGLEGSVAQCAETLQKINALQHISLEGIFTHYAVADETSQASDEYTLNQTKKILDIDDLLKEKGLNLPYVHFLNSASGVYYYNERSSFARLGIILYGLYPNPEKPLPFKPKTALELKAVISQIKYIEKGDTVSYGRTYTASKRTKIATVTAGYADGFPRALSNKGFVLVHGQRCPITGRICMDQFMCDVSNVADVKVDDEVILIGGQGENKITAEDIAQMTGTIGYEVICDISHRVPRIKAL